MKRVDVVSAIIRNEEGEILLVQNRKGDSFYWGPPGGAVEEGETLEQALHREVREETGYAIRVTGLSSVREAFVTDRGHHVLFFTFFAQVTGGSIQISDPDDDIVEVRWADARQANELMPDLAAALQLEAGQEQARPFYAFEGTRK